MGGHAGVGGLAGACQGGVAGAREGKSRSGHTRVGYLVRAREGGLACAWFVWRYM